MKRRTSLRVLPVLLGAAAGCAGPGAAPERAGSSPSPAVTAAKADPGRNACRLLTHEEVSTLTGRKVVMADQSEAGEDYSTCDWEDALGQPVFGLTAYWSGGKERFDTWRLAQGLGDAALKKSEGVSASEVIEQGLVPGLGDAAYFSEVLPSLLLKGDTLFELRLALVPKAGSQFPELARKLLAKAG